MTKIILDLFNYHEIFRNKKINSGDVVKNLRNAGSIDLIVNTSEKDSALGYVIFGHSFDEKGNIIERKYWAREKVNYEEIKKFKPNQSEIKKYQNKLTN